MSFLDVVGGIAEGLAEAEPGVELRFPSKLREIISRGLFSPVLSAKEKKTLRRLAILAGSLEKVTPSRRSRLENPWVPG